MRMKFLAVSILLLISFYSFGQFPGDFIKPNTSRGIRYNGLMADREFYPPLHDTDYIPMQPGAIVCRPSDNSLWTFDGLSWIQISKSLIEVVRGDTINIYFSADDFIPDGKTPETPIAINPDKFYDIPRTDSAIAANVYHPDSPNAGSADTALQDAGYGADSSTLRFYKKTGYFDVKFGSGNGYTRAQVDSAIQANKTRFGIEDNTSTVARSVDFASNNFNLTGVGGTSSFVRGDFNAQYGEFRLSANKTALFSQAASGNDYGAVQTSNGVTELDALVNHYQSIVALDDGGIKIHQDILSPIGDAAAKRLNTFTLPFTAPANSVEVVRMLPISATINGVKHFASDSGDINLGTISSGGGTVTGTSPIVVTGTTTPVVSFDTTTHFTNNHYNTLYQPLENQRLSTTNNVGFNSTTLATQSSVPSSPSSGITLYADATNRLSWVKADGFTRTLRFPYAGNTVLTAESKPAYTWADSADVSLKLNSNFGTSGSILFRGATGVSQINNKFFYDSLHNRLGVGTNTPVGVVDFVSSEPTGIINTTNLNAAGYGGMNIYDQNNNLVTSLNYANSGGGSPLITSSSFLSSRKYGNPLHIGVAEDSAGLIKRAITIISPSGYVGINNASPTEQLHVKGRVRIDTLLTGTTSDSVLVVNGGVLKKVPQSSITGIGSVSSVGLTMPGVIFNSSVTGSPITTSGTLAPSLATQTANRFLGSPDGSSGTPTFRALVAADIPAGAVTGIDSLRRPAGTDSIIGRKLGIFSLEYMQPSNNVYAADYGMSTTASAVDNSTALNYAITLAGTLGKNVLIGTGVFLVNQINWLPTVSIYGAGITNTTLKSSTAVPMFIYQNTATVDQPTAGIYDLGMDGNSIGTTGITLRNAYHFHAVRLYIRNFVTYDVSLLGEVGVEFTKCLFGAAPTDVKAVSTVQSNTAYNSQSNLVTFRSCGFYSATNWAIDWANGAGLIIDFSDFETNGTANNLSTGAITVAGMSPSSEGVELLMNGTWFERNNGTAIALNTSNGTTRSIIQNSIIQFATGTTNRGIYLNQGNATVHKAFISGVTVNGHTNDIVVTGTGASAETIASTYTVSSGAISAITGSSSTSFWNVLGNSTSAATDFLGTTSNTSLRVRTNNVQRLIVDSSNGYVGIGTFTAPTRPLQVGKNFNGAHLITAANTTAGTSASAGFSMTTDQGADIASLFKYSSATTAYKNLSANDLGFYNSTVGNISVLNDYASGNISLSAGGHTAADLTIASTGKVSFQATNTATGTTGAQTISKPSGKVNFAAGASTLVVTNTLVTTASVVMVTVEGTDATATSARVTLASGSFTITLNAAATAETKVSFWVIN